MHSRRRFVHALAFSPLAAVAVSSAVRAADAPTKKSEPKPPALAADLVQAVVGAAHRDPAKVRALVEATPLLVNACWDHGGGDFETPLEAAAHTGRREIAEFLLAHRARPSVFADAMLGRLDAVKAAFAVDPRLPGLPGPHGFTLLHCARAGGAPAEPVVTWLRAQGATDTLRLPLAYRKPA